MGLIRVVGASVGDVLKEQWKEVFRCGEIDMDTMMVRARKLITKGSSNEDPEDQIVSNGSLLIVGEGQCVIVVSQGKVLDYSMEPGEHIFEDKERGKGARGFLHQVGNRIAYGGVQAVTDRVYYINMKECFGNRFLTPEPVPVSVHDDVSGAVLEMSVTAGGVYSYRVADPLKFYKALTGNIEGIYTRAKLTAQITNDLLTALGPAMSKLSADSLRPSQFPGEIPAVRRMLCQAMAESWGRKHGLEISNIAFDTLTVNGTEIIRDLQHTAVFRENQKSMEEEWNCSCGTVNIGKFCTECGKMRPV